MRGGWVLLLAGLIVWAAHFLILYLIGEFVGATPAGRWSVVLTSIVAIGADGAVVSRARHLTTATEFDRWRRSVIGLGAVVSAIAVTWQTLPALL